MASDVYYCSMSYDRLEATSTLPAKFKRMLARIPLGDMFFGKNAAVKMHFGGNLGYTTIHPLFVQLLADALKKAGAKVFVTDIPADVKGAKHRGYTEEVIGAPIVATTGLFDKYYYSVPVDYKTLKEIQIAGHIKDADALIDFSHVKGHGACAYGGACKNIAMGCVTAKTRSNIHELQGGFIWDKDKCKHDKECIRACRYNANAFDENENYEINYDNCMYCQHCVNACPTGALKANMDAFNDFQEGMALSTSVVLNKFVPGNAFFINVLTNITYLCDCWGFSTSPLVPDIGIMASNDIVALETASLDAINEYDLLPNSLPIGRRLADDPHGTKHLLEKVHGKDPFIQVRALERYGLGSMKYNLITVK